MEDRGTPRVPHLPRLHPALHPSATKRDSAQSLCLLPHRPGGCSYPQPGSCPPGAELEGHERCRTRETAGKETESYLWGQFLGVCLLWTILVVGEMKVQRPWGWKERGGNRERERGGREGGREPDTAWTDVRDSGVSAWVLQREIYFKKRVQAAWGRQV